MDGGILIVQPWSRRSGYESSSERSQTQGTNLVKKELVFLGNFWDPFFRVYPINHLRV